MFVPRSVAILLLATFAMAPGIAVQAEDTPLPANKLERFQLRHANCKWTNEMGNYMYECLKANFNMNAHWCHNEAMDAFCPKQDEAPSATEAKPADAAKPAN
jgi:hypothetical protein